MASESFKYYAFISYSHKDKKIARKLQKKLQSYHLPAALRKTNRALPKKLSPIFIDESDLVPSGSLKDSLQANLERSNYLIVICSPSSARSEYVNDEVKYFINSGRGDRIIPFIVDGEPHSRDAETECFPPAILALPREDELLGIDLQKFGMRAAFIRVVASLLRLDIDDFVSREAKARRIKAAVYASIAAALVFIAVMLMPPPYNETYADNVLESSVLAYVTAGKQYDDMSRLTDCAINNPSDFKTQLERYKSQHSFTFSTVPVEVSMYYLSEMMKTGKVMPWSRVPMKQQECEELLTLAPDRAGEYRLYTSVLEFVMTDDYAKHYYGAKYPELLAGLLEIDADIAAELYQIVCRPHVTERYAEHSARAETFAANLSSVPKQNEHLTEETARQSEETLTSLKGKRSEYVAQINSLGVIEAYKVRHPDTEDKATASSDVHAASQSADKTDSENTPEARMLNDLLGYIYNVEIICRDILWCLDYIDRFDKARNWESLQLARASVAIAKLDISRRRLPDQEMTIDDQKRLTAQGVDVSAFGTLDAQFKALQTTMINSCVNLDNAVMNEVFLINDWAICKRYTANFKKTIECDIISCANMADYVLTSLNNPVSTKKFNALLEKYCPETRSRQVRTAKTLQQIETYIQENLDRIEELVVAETEILGARSNMFNVVEYALKKQDINTLTQNVMTISDMPPMILTPRWFNSGNMNIFYFWRENGKIIKTPSSRYELPRVPDGCRITSENVSLDMVNDYQQELQANGLAPAGRWEEDNKLTLYYEIGKSKFAVIWDNGKVTILMRENPVCFVRGLYLSLMVEAQKEQK